MPYDTTLQADGVRQGSVGFIGFQFPIAEKLHVIMVCKCVRDTVIQPMS